VQVSEDILFLQEWDGTLIIHIPFLNRSGISMQGARLLFGKLREKNAECRKKIMKLVSCGTDISYNGL